MKPPQINPQLTLLPQKQGPMSLLQNPLFGAGMGLLSAGYDSRINPYQAAMSGMSQAQQIKWLDEKRKEEQAKAQREADQSARLQKTREALSGILGAPMQSVQMGPPTPEGEMQAQMQTNPNYDPVLASLAEADPAAAAGMYSQNRGREHQTEMIGLQNQSAMDRMMAQISAQNAQSRIEWQNRMAIAEQNRAADQARLATERVQDVTDAQRQETINKLPPLEVERDQLQATLADVRAAKKIQEDGWFGQTGPLADWTPNISQSTQELDALYKRLGVDRLSAFKGSTSEKELAVAFQGGPSMDKDTAANVTLLNQQEAALLRSIQRNEEQMRRITGAPSQSAPPQSAPVASPLALPPPDASVEELAKYYKALQQAGIP